MNCENCDKEFEKLSSQIAKTNANYCSKSCAAIVNNSKKPKRKKKKHYCSECDSECKTGRKYCTDCYIDVHLSKAHKTLKKKNRKRIQNRQYFCSECNVNIGERLKYCRDCSKKKTDVKYIYEDVTIGELKENYPNIHRYNAKIRGVFRSLHKDVDTSKCQNCGWEHFVEFCHIKPLASFEDTDYVLDANSRDNLSILCPNCHWMLDNGKLEL